MYGRMYACVCVCVCMYAGLHLGRSGPNLEHGTVHIYVYKVRWRAISGSWPAVCSSASRSRLVRCAHGSGHRQTCEQTVCEHGAIHLRCGVNPNPRGVRRP